MRNRKYIEIERMGWVGVTLAGKKLKRALEHGSVSPTGREVILDTDFRVCGDFDEWDREAGVRIANKSGLDKAVRVFRF